jgi:predicted nucleic acid-binding protein
LRPKPQNTPILDEDYISAAKFYNECRQNGVQGSHIDLLICAVAVRLDIPIFTSDKDFGFYQQHLPIKLYSLSLEQGAMENPS